MDLGRSSSVLVPGALRQLSSCIKSLDYQTPAAIYFGKANCA